jgi:hypothetical protein
VTRFTFKEMFSMKVRMLLAACSALLVVAVAACSSAPSNEEACSRFQSLCESNTSDPDAGSSSSVTVTCNPDNFDKISNGDDVKECIVDAKDCAAATACMLTGKP